MQYNTSRSLILLKEYGRGVMQMASHLLTIEDKELRQKNALAVIEVMALLNAAMKGQDDFRQKLWDHLFVMTDYRLEVDCPFPIPSREAKAERPAPIDYPKNNLKRKHLGKNLLSLIEKAKVSGADEEKVGCYTRIIGAYMKTCYQNWHKENIHDSIIKTELYDLSGGTLTYVNDESTDDVSFNENGSRRLAGGGNQQRFGNNGINGNGGKGYYKQGGGYGNNGGGGNSNSGGSNNGGGKNYKKKFNKGRYSSNSGGGVGY
jgi:hypothetical protein